MKQIKLAFLSDSLTLERVLMVRNSTGTPGSTDEKALPLPAEGTILAVHSPGQEGVDVVPWPHERWVVYKVERTAFLEPMPEEPRMSTKGVTLWLKRYKGNLPTLPKPR